MCIVLHVQNVENETGKVAVASRALLKNLKYFTFVTTVPFLVDFLEIFTELSLIFQKSIRLLVRCIATSKEQFALRKFYYINQEKWKMYYCQLLPLDNGIFQVQNSSTIKSVYLRHFRLTRNK